MSVRFYILTHKACSLPPDPTYVPLQVGSALHEPLPCLHDDTGDNISAKNPFYSELTGIYWIWKNNTDSEIIGTAHYRRYLLTEDHIFSAEEAKAALQNHDLVSTKQVLLPTTYYEAFGADHHRKDLDALTDVIREMQPGYSETFHRIVHGNRTYFGNMFIMPRELFHAYCDFLFSLLFETEKLVDMTGYTAYQKRLLGFLSELLLTVYVRKNCLRVLECMVGMCGEKKETKDTENAVAERFAAGDLEGARSCILSALKKRPDLLMEASDVYGHLRAAMEVIAICDAESAAGKQTMLERDRNFQSLTEKVKRLNRFISAKRAEELHYSHEAFESFCRENGLSEEAVKIAETVLPQGKKENILFEV